MVLNSLFTTTTIGGHFRQIPDGVRGFDGDNVPVEEFFRDMDESFEVNGPEDDDFKIAMVRLCLYGRAKNWLNGAITHGLITEETWMNKYETLKEFMIERYRQSQGQPPFRGGEETHDYFARMVFNVVNRMQAESLERYNDTQKRRIYEKALRNDFRRGLLPEIRVHLPWENAIKDYSPDKILKAAVAVENYLRNREEYDRMDDMPPPPARAMEEIYPRENNNYIGEWILKAIKQNKKSLRRRLRRNCYNCGIRGHIIKDCFYTEEELSEDSEDEARRTVINSYFYEVDLHKRQPTALELNYLKIPLTWLKEREARRKRIFPDRDYVLAQEEPPLANNLRQ